MKTFRTNLTHNIIFTVDRKNYAWSMPEYCRKVGRRREEDHSSVTVVSKSKNW